MRLLLAMIAASILAACASMGRPQGGPRDEDAPVFMRSNPMAGQLNVSGERIVIEFDENVQVQDAQTKVIVSPPQKVSPKISALGKRVIVTMRDTLLPHTTYTLDFSDAIKDLNEGNVLDGFALDFATGDEMDSLRLSGMVFEAQTLEPAQGMLVGVHPKGGDTLLTSTPFERVTRTNQLGQFTLRNLKPGSYCIYAVNDVNRDYKWDRSEDIAFLDSVVLPLSEPTTVTDTLKTADGRDSIFTHPATHFYPDDILLTWSNSGYRPQYLSDYKRPDRHKITFLLNARADSLPGLTVIGRDGSDLRCHAVVEASATMDTLTYWLRDSSLIMADTLLVEAKYFKTDSTDQLALQTDTLKYLIKPEKKKKKNQELLDSLSLGNNMRELTLTVPNNQELNLGYSFKVSAPLARLDSTMVKMDIKRDTIWRKVAPPVFSLTDSLKPLAYSSPPYAWKAGETYRITIDSAAMADIYGVVNKAFTREFQVKSLDDYSKLIFTITPPLQAPALVELLNTQDKPVKAVAVEGDKATLDFVAPGSYYARLYIDRDSSGIWTPGSLLDSLQPEDTYYYPKKINLKKNWTVEQAWNLDELPVDQQKPQAIKKNKPKKKPGEMPERTEDEEDEEDEFFDDPFMRAAMGKNRDNTDGFNSNRRRY